MSDQGIVVVLVLLAYTHKFELSALVCCLAGQSFRLAFEQSGDLLTRFGALFGAFLLDL